MIYQVGQQFFDGEVVVASVDASNGNVVLAFPQLGSDPNQPYELTVTPTTTFEFVAAAYDQARAAAGL